MLELGIRLGKLKPRIIKSANQNGGIEASMSKTETPSDATNQFKVIEFWSRWTGYLQFIS